jgi:hypothetical protein
MNVRRNYRSLTDAERERFVQALRKTKEAGVVDLFAAIHRAHDPHPGIHGSSQFLPWHREALFRFERELQKFQPNITIPYWDPTVDRSPSDPLWANSFLGQFNSAWGLGRELGSGPPPTLELPTLEEVETNQGHGNYDTFWRELENPISNSVRVWVGGVVNTTSEPSDPVFYLHYCWIDLLWAQWQCAHPSAPFMSSGVNFDLNDGLMEWSDRTPADVLDHHALGYRYDVEPFTPPPVRPRSLPWLSLLLNSPA